MAKYKSEVVAWQNRMGNEIPEWLQGRGMGSSGQILVIVTPKGVLKIAPGDWVIKSDDENEFTLNPSLFELLFQLM